MVKARPSSSSSLSSPQERPSCCPPLASLSLASTLLKSSKPPPFHSFLKRPPSLRTDSLPLSMESNSPSPPPSSLLYSSESHLVQASEDESNTGEELLIPRGDRRHTSKTAESHETSLTEDEEVQGVMCGRQRLQQHRIQMSGNVIIPDTWGREQQLQDWVGCGIVEDALRPAGLMSARTALVNECQRRGNKPVRTSPAMSADVEVS